MRRGLFKREGLDAEVWPGDQHRNRHLRSSYLTGLIETDANSLHVEFAQFPNKQCILNINKVDFNRFRASDRRLL